MEARPVLYLIDGHALAYRSYFALQRGGFATSKGEKHQRNIRLYPHLA